MAEWLTQPTKNRTTLRRVRGFEFPHSPIIDGGSLVPGRPDKSRWLGSIPGASIYTITPYLVRWLQYSGWGDIYMNLKVPVLDSGAKTVVVCKYARPYPKSNEQEVRR